MCIRDRGPPPPPRLSSSSFGGFDSLAARARARRPVRIGDGRGIAEGRSSAQRTHPDEPQGGLVHDRVVVRALTRGPGGGRRASVLSRKHVCLPGGSRGASASEAESPPGWTRRRSSSPQHSTRPPPTLPVGALGARPGVAADTSPPKNERVVEPRYDRMTKRLSRLVLFRLIAHTLFRDCSEISESA